MGETRRPTVFVMKGTPRRVIQIGVAIPAANRPAIGQKHLLTDNVSILKQHLAHELTIAKYVPVGGSRVHVKDANAFQKGQQVIISRTITAEWIKAQGMDNLFRDGKHQTWLKAGEVLSEVRFIAEIDLKFNKIRLDIPLTDALDSKYGAAATIATYAPPAGVASEIGVSDITFLCEPSESGRPLGQPPYFTPIEVMTYTEDVYIRRCIFQGFINAICCQTLARRITIVDCKAIRTAPTDKARGYPCDYSIVGTQVLMLRCSTEATVRGAASIAGAVQGRTAGPNAFVGHKSAIGSIQVGPSLFEIAAKLT